MRMPREPLTSTRSPGASRFSRWATVSSNVVVCRASAEAGRPRRLDRAPACAAPRHELGGAARRHVAADLACASSASAPSSSMSPSTTTTRGPAAMRGHRVERRAHGQPGWRCRCRRGCARSPAVAPHAPALDRARAAQPRARCRSAAARAPRRPPRPPARWSRCAGRRSASVTRCRPPPPRA